MAASRLKAATVDLSADFLNFGAHNFPFKSPFKKCFKLSFFRWGVKIHPVLELQLPTPLLCFASQSSADRIVVAASRLLGAAAACVILLSFAAGSRK